MMEGASAVNAKIIQQMMDIEIAGVGGGAAPAETAAPAGGGTASVSTAVGSFTVASGGVELKKQTNLLKSIKHIFYLFLIQSDFGGYCIR